MRVNAIKNNYQSYGMKTGNMMKTNSAVISSKNSELSFQGKHTCAKVIGGLTGALGLIGSVAGVAIMTGGIGLAALPAILGYSAMTTASGVWLGHQIDKDSAKEEEKEKNKTK